MAVYFTADEVERIRAAYLEQGGAYDEDAWEQDKWDFMEMIASDPDRGGIFDEDDSEEGGLYAGLGAADWETDTDEDEEEDDGW